MGFVSRSLLVLLALYGLVFAVADVCLLHGRAPLWWAAIAMSVLVAVQYLVSPWLIQWFFSIHWDADEIPAAQRAFVEQLCRDKGLPPIKLGVIWSATPNAFAFGRVRRDARVVVTEGLLKILTEEEINAVLAHEVGHVAHYDFAVMALAAIGPLMLYQMYIWTNRINNMRIVSYAAYLAYWVSQLLVLLLNRTREFGADHFSAVVTGEPSALSSALVKIAYGMVRERSEAQQKVQHGTSSEDKKDARRVLQFGQTLGLLGIAAPTGGEALAISNANPEEAARVMRWDLVNPWARFYELGSTHPLTAMRLKALNRQAAEFGRTAEYPLPPDSRTRWSAFPLEFALWLAPLACGFFLASYLWIGREFDPQHRAAAAHLLPKLLIALGITWALKIAWRYRGQFRSERVSGLLEDLSVSQMRPIAVELQGEVIGHGIPGAIWSADLVLQDETGLMFLYYRSSIPFGRLFFAVRNADRFIGEQVKVKGWYRRGLRPYVEISSIEADVVAARRGSGPVTLFGKKDEAAAPAMREHVLERSYSHWIQLAASAVSVVAGLVWLL